MYVYHHPESNLTHIEFETVIKGDAIAVSLRTRPIPGVVLVRATPVAVEDVLLVHEQAYVDALRRGEPRALAASNGIGWTPQLWAAVCASTGSVRDAVLHALRERTVTGALSSGLHHARRERGAGYCTVNGLTVAALAARAAGALRVLVLDLDAHCGGGTASTIAGLAGIEQVDVSVIGYDQYPSRADARLVMSTGATYLADIARALEEIASPGSIDVVIYNAGMDPHRLAGGLDLIDDAVITARERMVFDWAASHGVPVAWTLAGGYTVGTDMAGLVDLHRITVAESVRPG